MKIVFATNNQHKLDEVRNILGDGFEIVSLADIGCHEDIPETGETLEDNALQKAQYVYDHYHVSCFADDTGLEVDALDGAPGVHTARYASLGQPESVQQQLDHDSEANTRRLLRELEGKQNRNARFRTVIALIEKRDVCPCGCTSIKQIHRFEGIVEGEIATEKRGDKGFGYDPVFIPEDYGKTFAELGVDIKNQISHRARATQKLAKYLSSLLLFCLFAFLPFHVHAQVGTWHNYLAYHDVQQIQAAGNDLFVLASNNLYQYNKQDQSIYTYDKVNGMSDTNIALIRWCQQAKRLVAVYSNTNIDLIETNGNVTNISDVYNKIITGEKTVNNITIDGHYAYLACGFGIVKLNVKDAEISESYMLGFPVNAIALTDTHIYARSSNNNGVWSALLTSNLIDKSNWQQTTSYPTFDQANTDYDDNIELVNTLNPGGPDTNYFGFMKFLNGKLYTCNGDYQHKATIQLLKDNEWEVYPDEGISTITGVAYDALYCFDVDPQNEDHLFAGGRNGLYEYNNGKFVNYYDYQNSPIEIFDGKLNHKEYQLVTGVKFDTSGNLWILNSQAPTTSLIKLSNGAFTKYNETELMKLNDGGFTNKSNGNLSNIIFDSQGLMWFTNNNWVLPALYQYDTKTDALKAYEKFINQDGTTPGTIEGVSAVVEDKDGNIWIGTTQGPFLFEQSQWSESNPYFTQVKVPRNDGTNYADYLLSGIDITSIAIDGGGRKWFGTNGNGVYLISADNMEQIQHFTAAESPLLSDVIQSIAINQTTGEVFFGTDEGLCSYVSDATETNTEMNKDNVWAYPNPVTPEYTGSITVTGLTYNADVKIVAANGALIAEGKSNGGTFIWDGCNKKGERVASGIYMVVTATNTGEKGTVCKIAIVR